MRVLPPGWRLVRLAEVADTALGKMLDRGKPRGLPEIPYLRNVNIQWGRIDTHDLLTMELADNERERFAVEPGDLLACEGGEIGRAAIWRGIGTYVGYQKALHRVRTSGELHLPYLRYLLELYSRNGTLERFSTGSTIAHLPQQAFRELPVPLPPLDEQHHIVDILEGHLSRLDAANASLARATRRLASYEAAALSVAREGKERALRELAEIQGGIQKQPKRTPTSNSFPFLRVANVTKDGLDLTDVHSIELFAGELDRLRLLEGDLLVVEGNGSPSQIGRAAIWDDSVANCVHQNHLIRVRANRHLLTPEYLEAVWNSPANRQALTDLASSSSGLHTLSVSKLSALRLPLPSLDRQKELTDRLSVLRDNRRRLDTEARRAVRRAAQLRRALLNAAFSGRLTGRASDMDLVEETADV